MRLTFSILWFDDRADYFDSLDLEPLRKEILSWGFSPKIEQVTTSEEFTKYSPFKDFDLIVVDQHLEEYEDGQEFIAQIRSQAIYTEIIFYTAGNAGGLWDAIREKQLEGIFVSSKTEILAKITKVGYQSVRKVLDLENMRGIVMAEVGELDHLLDKILTIGISGLSEAQQKAIFDKFHEAATKQNQDFGIRLNNFLETPKIIEMLDLCDSSKRWQNFNRLWKHHDKLKKKNKIGNFEEDVLKPRNFLAHGKPEPQANGGYIFHYQGKKFHFTDDSSLELRQTILKYKMVFSDILVALE